MDKNILLTALELGIRPQQAEAVINLLDEGATVPFISRYRKEATDSLDEVAVLAIRDRMLQLRELDKRKESILKSIEEQGKLTDALKAKIEAAETMSAVEDIYMPFKPKRRTKASIAKEKGLEPLADAIFLQEENNINALAAGFISDEKGVKDLEEALQGARDIIAEKINEDQDARAQIRRVFEKQGVFKTKVIAGKEEEGQKFKDYFEWSEPIENAPSHRVLAMRRGEKELFLSLSAEPEDEVSIAALETRFVKTSGDAAKHIKTAIKDGYKRLLKPSMETEIRLMSKKKADLDAINIFAENLRQLLLAAPLGQKNVLALDPGFKSGCKLVCLDAQGKLLENHNIYPHVPQNQKMQASALIKELVKKYDVEAIAIGNGTAGRETEVFVNSIGLDKKIQVIMVNESGASVYSASETARNEFPDHDLTVRGSVSIGRRIMDPLAELVKIDPKAIGVGQYQHDVDQNALKDKLDDTVMSCVNAVGVELNTASKELLTYVSGLGPSLAQNIVDYRNEKGAFKNRAELKKVARLGDKAFEQAAGFLRLRNAVNPLDTSAVHPESYGVVETMAKDLKCSVTDLMSKPELRALVDLKKYVTEKTGLPTLRDIMDELAKPGRDPRQTFEAFSFAEGIEKMSDLRIGMVLPGIVTNITDFGAFVDIGVHQDGLVHLSQLSDRYIKHPTEAVKVQQKVEVKILEVDINRKRISLSMKKEEAPARRPKTDKPENGKYESDKNSKTRKEEQPEAEGSFADKLSMLKARFGN